jgi:hypothetical protein
MAPLNKENIMKTVYLVIESSGDLFTDNIMVFDDHIKAQTFIDAHGQFAHYYSIVEKYIW